ncbi:MAG: hypothetical protein F6K21_14640 [Symploca sp. SIO2D2]|nr:hypothetical protein [Symploca sp. SIO2D2]
MKTISVPFTTEVISNNQVSSVEQTEAGELIIGIEAILSDLYQPIQETKQYPFEISDTYTVMVQELGLPNQKVRYKVAVKQCYFIDGNNLKHHFNWPVKGLSLRLGISEAVIYKMIYFLQNTNLSFVEISNLLNDLYQVKPCAGVLNFMQANYLR